jgi:DNA-binding response OmpR family regulator
MSHVEVGATSSDNQTTGQTPGLDPQPRNRLVLLVEDEATLRRIVARNLETRGARVHEAGTAAEAIAAVAAEQPDLMLLDINLPDRTGWDVLRELKRQGIEVPTVVVSAVRVSQVRLQEFCPLAYLPKPFPIEALLRLVFGDQRPGRGTTIDEP